MTLYVESTYQNSCRTCKPSMFANCNMIWYHNMIFGVYM